MSRKLALQAIAIFIVIHIIGIKMAFAETERPPQYVMLGFDGSYKNDIWDVTRNFSLQKKKQGTEVHFTYFVSNVYLLDKTNKAMYVAPGYRMDGEKLVKNHGSAIGWGDDQQDIAQRMQNMNLAYSEGHEIGSHAMGHWDGGAYECAKTLNGACAHEKNGQLKLAQDLRWTDADWTSEFTQFFEVFNNFFALNKLKPTKEFPQGLNFKDHVIGFRAPQLGTSEGLYTALPKFGFKYDTSQTSKQNEWPTQHPGSGIWNFPLAEVYEPGTGKRSISMDYNFCYMQTNELRIEDPTLIKVSFKTPDGRILHNNADCYSFVKPEQKARMKQQMLGAYMSYFRNNYYGNRAPVYIGHHFSQWMSGAYFEAYIEFANTVCGLPEVKCVNYAQLMSYMNSLSLEKRAAFQKGEFTHMEKPKTLALNADKFVNISAALVKNDDGQIQVQTAGEDQDVKVNYSVAGLEAHAPILDMDEVRARFKNKSATITGHIYNSLGVEIKTVTQEIRDVGTTSERLSSTQKEDMAVAGHLPQSDTTGN